MAKLKDFDYSKYKKMKPPKDNSLETFKEIKDIDKLRSDESFVKDNDNLIKAYKPIVGEDDQVKSLVDESQPIILKLKKHFNRPRPKVLAKKMNIKMKDIEMASMKTPSYPSGHSVQGILIGKVLGDKYPKAKSAFAKTGENISYSRRVARAHYKSDSKMGEQLGNSMYKHIKNKI